jgi:bifunctional non-homologous end joining protein LigD
MPRGNATRGGHDCTSSFPEVADALARFKRGPFIVDGQVCLMDEIGRSDFNRLQDRAVRRCYYPDCDPVAYAIFDLLVGRGENIMCLPLVERKAQLKKLFSENSAQDFSAALFRFPHHSSNQVIQLLRKIIFGLPNNVEVLSRVKVHLFKLILSHRPEHRHSETHR